MQSRYPSTTMSVRSRCAALAREIEREEMVAFGIDRRRRRVEVFRLAVAERAAAEGDHLAGRRVRRDHKPVAVEVVVAALTALDQPGRGGERKVDAVALELVDEAAPRVGRISETESLDASSDANPRRAQYARAAAPRSPAEHSREISRRDSVRFVDRLAFAAGARRARILRLQLDARLGREHPHRIAKRYVLRSSAGT